MKVFEDFSGKPVRLTDERLAHLSSSHPEMRNQLRKILQTLKNPDRVMRSRTNITVRLFYRFYKTTPVGAKHLCVVVKTLVNDYFVITAYFTDVIKRGDFLWTRTKARI